jgi:hypothetical protein
MGVLLDDRLKNTGAYDMSVRMLAFSEPRRESHNEMSGPVIKGAILAGSGRSQWSTRESPRSTETQ